MCSAGAERDVPFGRDVCFASDVRFARVAEHITSLCTAGAIHHCALALLALFGGGFSASAWLGIIPYVILLVLFELLLNPFFVWVLKNNIKSLKSKGKMGYSPVAEMEFYDERFIEVTPDTKSEQKYSAVERVSVITDKVIYIHVNNVASYILPLSCFESNEQYNEFLDFVKTKCTNVDVY